MSEHTDHNVEVTPGISFDGLGFRRRQHVRLVQVFACPVEIQAAYEMARYPTEPTTTARPNSRATSIQ